MGLDTSLSFCEVTMEHTKPTVTQRHEDDPAEVTIRLLGQAETTSLSQGISN
ncbi:hypothetical protein GCM10009560_14320 [Nonomuraea longicatena]|uniref:Uncharacterized protein n=1 Tax=Nonomuraea longicatena TaxID=83682 RepID=A0ABN1NX06_9ACTN